MFFKSEISFIFVTYQTVKKYQVEIISLHNATPDETFRPDGNNHVLFIGIDDYQYLPKLNSAVNTCERLAEVLAKKFIFKPTDFTKLYNQDATKSKIYETLKHLQKTLHPDEDSLIIYFYGHGLVNQENDQSYWALYESDSSKAETLLEHLHFFQSNVKPFPLKHVLVISESIIINSLYIHTLSRGLSCFAYDSYLRSSRYGWSAGYDLSLYPNIIPGKIAEHLIDYLNNTEKYYICTMEISGKINSEIETKYEVEAQYNPIINTGNDGGQYVFFRKENEDSLWLQTTKDDNIKDYDNFLRIYPQSKFEKEAMQRIKFLNEELYWKNMNDEGNQWAYNQYLNNYPNGNHAQEAEVKIKKLSEENEWDKAQKDNTLAALTYFINQFPKSIYISEAEKQLKNFVLHEDEVKFWKKTEGKNTITEYDNYISKYPNGLFTDEALTRKMKLKTDGSIENLDVSHAQNQTISESNDDHLEDLSFWDRLFNNKIFVSAIMVFVVVLILLLIYLIII